MVFISLAFQLVAPVVASALTSGPTQPEVSSFEPVGTTDMVDLFTGDFVYNIPLLDIEGYPVNISYHSGGDMDQEASWVGYGWNINPGVINRHVRGLPDDFNGELIQKRLNIKPEKNTKIGLSTVYEPFGVGGPPLNLKVDFGGSLNFSNYRGVSADLGLSLSANVNIVPKAMSGVNLGAGGSVSLGVGSQSGADVDVAYNLGINFKTSQTLSQDVAVSAGWSKGTGYNTRYGLKGINEGVSLGINLGGRNSTGPSYSRSVPVSLRNYVPVITNVSQLYSFRGQIKIGMEAKWNFLAASIFGQMSRLEYESNGDKSGYGYFYAQNAPVDAIHDFTRDKDGLFNETMNFLPLGNMTYDVYSVSGQGTGGSFRPFRNDFGSVFDPAISSPENKEVQINMESGFPDLFEIGVDGNTSRTITSSGPWDQFQRPFTKNEKGSLYENVYFKQAGELTSVDQAFYTSIGNFEPISGSATQNIPLKKPNVDKKRDPRANLITYFTGTEASKYGVASSPYILSYRDNGFANGANFEVDTIARVGGVRKGHHISEIVQTQTDGRRYIFGIPAMNSQQHELTFAVSGQANPNNLVAIKTGAEAEDSEQNKSGIDHFFSKTSTPPFAHSYLLTSVLSTDYVDVTGDGVTDDDLGTFTKFNYSRKDAGYKWRAPYEVDMAQFNEGAKSDPNDNKGNYIEGTREQWMLHSIESKNYVAEFYTSARSDAKGAGGVGASFKLDSIKLYNKHERFITPNTAIPVKTIFFNYDYSLCPGVPNSDAGGKLTLKKIYVRYGNSSRSMQSPYQFEYSNNFSYEFGAKDRWGMYKPNDPSHPNYDFPFVDQNDTNINSHAAAWSLTKIKLPSGGVISVEYEADDYAYVQNKEVTEMFKVAGFGATENFTPGAKLYINKNTPNNFLYFRRNVARENPNKSFKQNYLKNDEILYYNVATDLTKSDERFEPIKGYASVEAIGVCENNPDFGYVKLKPVVPVKGGALLSPITYTAINYGRYYLPHIIFPGSDPDKSGIVNIIAGVTNALGELLSFSKNAIKRMVEQGKGRDVKLSNSYVRLNSPGLKKKGGGIRVRELRFSDNWSKLSGGINNDASYGKRYSYTVDIGNGQTISSGVASYEPLVGGDENPLRKPVDYQVQSGSKWPPNDPVGMYQELPLGESLYPAPVVGYSRVTVQSIHKDYAKSAQAIDIHEFYTAKEFPIVVKSLPKNELETEETYGFKEQKVVYRASQGYALRFNDMHGKPKRNEHRVEKPGGTTSELVSYTHYKYNTSGNELSNEVPVMVYDENTGKMKKTTKMLGVESDFTLDTREKTDRTKTNTWLANLNVSLVGVWPIPIPLPYWWKGSYENDFSSVVATKVIQQFGVLMEVESFQEGALTTVRNEAFDPVTGQAVITSVNNEYNDREYSVTYPAYWGYKSMGPSSKNIGFEDEYESLEVYDHQIIIPNAFADRFNIGDELFISYNDSGVEKNNNVWVAQMLRDTAGSNNSGCFVCRHTYGHSPDFYYDTVDIPNAHMYTFGYLYNDGHQIAEYDRPNESCLVNYSLKPRFKYSIKSFGLISNVRIKVIRPGAKNQLQETIQNYVGYSEPIDNNSLLKDNLEKLVSITAREYSDKNNAVIPKYDSIVNVNTCDSLNEFVNGTISVRRLFRELQYVKNRVYANPTGRDKGLFTAKSAWKFENNNIECIMAARYCSGTAFGECMVNNTGIPGFDNERHVYRYYAYPLISRINEFGYFVPDFELDPNWIVARTVTKWSPWGYELENKDAVGNYTAAQYGYNEQLPTALAQNAKQHQFMFEGFEDYQLLQPKSSLLDHFLNPFKSVFETSSLFSLYRKNNLIASNGMKLTKNAAHSGYYALETGSSGHEVIFDITKNNINQGAPRYLPFSFTYGKQYLISLWYRPKTISGDIQSYSAPVSGFIAKSEIIEGWQQFEYKVTMTNDTNVLDYKISLPRNAYIDDIRIIPLESNMKSFVYNPINQKLMATLDENNFASFFEYDQEGNLVRTKKETEKGIMTISESRSANPNTLKPSF
jgi:hypothetical protein